MTIGNGKGKIYNVIRNIFFYIYPITISINYSASIVKPKLWMF